MIVAGRVSQKMAPVLRQIYDQMAEPKWVLAMGVCASSGGMFNNYAIVQGVDHVVPVDIYLPGCPPRPEMLLQRDPQAARQDSGDAARRQPRGGDPRGRGGRAGRHPDHRAEGAAAVSEPMATARQRRRTATTPEVIGVRRGMFGAKGSGDTSGYGRLVRPVALPGSSPRPYGGYFDDVVDALAAVLGDGRVRRGGRAGGGVSRRADVRCAARASACGGAGAARRCRHCGSSCASASAACTTRDDAGRELHAVYPLMSITHNRRIRLEVAAPDADPHIPSLFGVYPTTDWHERETYDFFGIVFDGHPVADPHRDARRLGGTSAAQGLPVGRHSRRVPRRRDPAARRAEGLQLMSTTTTPTDGAVPDRHRHRRRRRR